MTFLSRLGELNHSFLLLLQDIKLGHPELGLTAPPNNTVELKFQGCHSLEISSRFLNLLPVIQNISIEGSEKLVMKSRIYESRLGTGQTAHIKNFEISDVSTYMSCVHHSLIHSLQVRHFDVSRQTFEGLSIDGAFWLKEVFIPRVPSLAFNFDHVNDFSVFGSRLGDIYCNIVIKT